MPLKCLVRVSWNVEYIELSHHSTRQNLSYIFPCIQLLKPEQNHIFFQVPPTEIFEPPTGLILSYLGPIKLLASPSVQVNVMGSTFISDGVSGQNFVSGYKV